MKKNVRRQEFRKVNKLSEIKKETG